MKIVWAATAVAGFALCIWARTSLPPGTVDFPVRIVHMTRRGPYRFLRHPMYVGTQMLIGGLGGVAAGFWNALALAALTELVTREWAWREEGSLGDPHR